MRAQATLIAAILLATNLMVASNLSPELQKLTSSSPSTDVIVQFVNAPSSTVLSGVTKGGGNLKKNYTHVRAALFNLPPAAIGALANNPNVKYVSPNRTISGKMEFAEPTTNANIALQYGYDGTGVGVAIVDSGISTSNDLSTNGMSRIVYSTSFVPGDATTADAYGHGTHVAGIVAGNGANSSGNNAIYTFRGIAPNARLINLRALDANGQGTDAAVISAIDQAIALKTQYNMRVLNLSLGRPVIESYTLDPLCQAVERAWQAGIVVTVAAGNDGRDNSQGTSGYGTITSPGIDPYVITVGAMNDERTVARGDDLMTTYSSKGPTMLDHIVKPDLVAPGNGIISVLAPGSAISSLFPNNVVPISYYKNVGNNLVSSTYFRLNGTSVAAPMVSGAAALLIQKDPTLTPDTVKARLMKTATKNFPASSTITDSTNGQSFTVNYDLFTVGAGYLDVWAALNNSDTVSSGSNALSPAATFNRSTGTVSVVNPANSAWSNAIVWGSQVVWGTSVVSSSNTVLGGTAIVWGSTSLQGNAIVWGTAILWGSSDPYSQTIGISGEAAP